MQLTTFVINRWTQPNRWHKMQRHLDQWPNLRVFRWPGLEPDKVTVTQWVQGNVRDPEKRVAIIQTYRSLFDHLADRHDGPWLILQDDIRLNQHPARDFTKPIHLYGGYHIGRHRHHNPDQSPHVHPFAFTATPEAVEPISRLLRNETRQLCETWTDYLTADTTSWDTPPSAVALPG